MVTCQDVGHGQNTLCLFVENNDGGEVCFIIRTCGLTSCDVNLPHNDPAGVAGPSGIEDNDRLANPAPSPTSCDCHRRWTKTADIGARCLCLKMEAVFLSVLLFELNRSHAFRCRVINNLFRNKTVRRRRLAVPCKLRPASSWHLPIWVSVVWHRAALLDEMWCRRLEKLYVESIVVDDTMAWLSTLGGAFSSLGDEFHDCAQIAGTISRHQYKLAMKLGDEIIVSKCNLFLALSLLQLGRLNRAKQIIREQYNFAVSLPECRHDSRLINMCQGAWAKLQHSYFLRRQRNLVNGNETEQN